MKEGLDLPTLAQQVSDERDRAADFRVSTSSLEMDENLRVRLGDSGIAVQPRELFHRQLAEKNGIPYKYYTRMRDEAPDLLRTNVNRWLSSANGEVRLVRTLAPTRGHQTNPPNTPSDGRAFLSASFKPLDNYDLLEALVPPLLGSGLELKSSQITEEKLFLQLVTPKLEAAVKRLVPGTHKRIDDPVQLGLVVSNSEVGCGALSIQVLLYRLVCTNGLIIGSDLPTFRRAHIGKEFSVDEAVLTDETRRLRDAAIWSQARDVITAAVNQTTLDKIVERLNGIAAIELKDPEKSVELIAKRYDLNESERGGVMQNLIRGGDVSHFGLVNAVTALANTEAKYDRVIELEQIGGRIAALAPHEIGNN